MKEIRSYILDILLIVVIGGFSLYLSVGKEVGTVFRTVTQANPLWLILLALLMLGYYVMDGISMWIAGRQYKKDYTKKQGFVTGIVGTLFSGLTPSSTGGQFAQIFIYNNQGIPPTVSSGILMGCFISYQIVILSYTTAIMLVHSSYFLSLGDEILFMAVIGYLVNVIVAIVLFVGAKSKGLQTFLIKRVVWVLSKIRIVKNYEATSRDIEAYFAAFRKELNILMHNKMTLFKVSMCNVVKLTIMYSMPFLSCKALGISVAMNQYVEFLALASIINLINAFLPIPGASGGSEGCFMILYGFLGQANTSSAMLIWRFITFYFGMILGFIVFVISKDTKKKLPTTLEG